MGTAKGEKDDRKKQMKLLGLALPLTLFRKDHHQLFGSREKTKWNQTD
jgi:hypothetical protein